MGYKLIRHPYALALEEAAKSMMPCDEVLSAIFCSIMKAAGMPFHTSSQMLFRVLRDQ